MRKHLLVALMATGVLILAGCQFLPKSASSTPSTPLTPSVSPVPTLTSRRPPQPDYNVDYCGVSGRAHNGMSSKVLLTIDDYPSDKGTKKGELMIEVADWAYEAGVMMEAFPVKGKTNAYLEATGVDLVQAVRERGTYVSNHSLSHRELVKLDQAGIMAEIQGGVRSTYLRPPYGSFTPDIKKLAEAEGYRLCMWNIDTNDWRKVEGEYPSAEELVQRVRTQLNHIPTGTPVVILGHYYTNYPEALPLIVEEVERTGNLVCPGPGGPVTEEVPYPIC